MALAAAKARKSFVKIPFLCHLLCPSAFPALVFFLSLVGDFAFFWDSVTHMNPIAANPRVPVNILLRQSKVADSSMKVASAVPRKQRSSLGIDANAVRICRTILAILLSSVDNVGISMVEPSFLLKSNEEGEDLCCGDEQVSRRASVAIVEIGLESPDDVGAKVLCNLLSAFFVSFLRM